ncbi:MAG: hypothetical protein HW412_2431, partial [Bacteroidetes bacterium]|nr:hypothetical protein [Bacteroidota bacterium]
MIEIGFSEPVLHPPLDNGISLRDTSRSIVSSSLRWMNATDVQIVPATPLKSKAWYHIRVVMDSVRDYVENTWKDSTFVVSFQSLDLRTTGVVEGVVYDSESARGRIQLTAVRIDV